MKLFSIFLFILFELISNTAIAKTFIPDGLNDDERLALEIMGFNDPARIKWQDWRKFEIAKEHFYRAALLARCDRIRKIPSQTIHFIPPYNEAIWSVVDKMKAGKITPNNLEIFRYANKSILWAIKNTPDKEKIFLRNLLITTQGKKTLQNLYASFVLTEYTDIAVDVRSGAHMPFAPIALKAYFENSGRIELLDRLIKLTIPKKFNFYEKLSTFISQEKPKESLELDDFLTVLDRNYLNLLQNFHKTLTPDELNSLAALQESMFFELARNALNAQEFNVNSAMTSGAKITNQVIDSAFDPFDFKSLNYSRNLALILDKEYALPELLEGKMFRMGPRDHVDNAHLQFCK